MDVRRLVERVAHVLGDAATPARVEAIAALVLEEAAAAPAALPPPNAAPVPPGPSPAASPRTADPFGRFIVMAYGVDRPGVAEALARVAADAGGAVLDASHHALDGYFTHLLLVDASQANASLAELQRRFATAGARLGVSVLVQHEWLFKTTRPG